VGYFRDNTIDAEVFAQADMVVIVGADGMMTHSPWQGKLPVCELVARPEYHALSRQPKVRVNGNLKASLRQLALAKQPGFTRDEVRAIRQRNLRHFKRPGKARLAAQDVLEITRALLPPQGILFSETGAFVCLLEHLWSVDAPDLFYGTSGGRTMGLMVPAILGARLAEPKRPMIGLGADGSLLMRLGELEVFARSKAAVPLVIINDQSLGTMKSRQKSRGMPNYGLDLYPVNFVAVANSCGLNGVAVETPEALERALKSALAADCATVIDVRIDAQTYQDGFGPTIGVLGPGTS
jgi:acetolactate synthase I/II/III large subunit